MKKIVALTLAVFLAACGMDFHGPNGEVVISDIDMMGEGGD